MGKAPEKVFFLLRPCRVKSMVKNSRDEHRKAPETHEHHGPGNGLTEGARGRKAGPGVGVRGSLWSEGVQCTLVPWTAHKPAMRPLSLRCHVGLQGAAGTAEDSEWSERESAKEDTGSDLDLNAQLHVLVGGQAGRPRAGAGRGDRSGTLHQPCPDREQTVEAGAGTEGCGGTFGATHG